MKPFYETLGAHARQLERLVDRRTLPRMKKMYDEAADAVAGRLHGLMKGERGESFTAHQQRILLAQFRHGQKILAGKMAGELSDGSKEAQVEAVHGLASDIARLEKHFTGADIQVPIEEAWKLRSLVNARRGQLDDMHRRSIARWGGRVFAKVHEATSIAVATDMTVDEAISTLPETVAGEWWQGERIVRTEMSWAYNLANADGIKESAEEVDGLMKRWTEHVNDQTGLPLDDRVAPDSLAMHGQVVEPEGFFEFPQDVPEMTAEEIERISALGPWEAPPNRPNDRAALQPWRVTWGIPAYTLVGGGRNDL